MVETSSDLPRKSLAIFGNFSKLRRYSEIVEEAFVWPSSNFWRIFGNL